MLDADLLVSTTVARYVKSLDDLPPGGGSLRSRSRAALLAAINLPATAAGVGRLYRDVCARFRRVRSETTHP